MSRRGRGERKGVTERQEVRVRERHTHRLVEVYMARKKHDSDNRVWSRHCTVVVH